MFIAHPERSDASERVYRATEQSMGFVMNLAGVWAWRPDVFEAFAALRAKLTSASTLSRRDQGVLVCAMASQLGDSYCSLAWGKSLAAEAGAPATAAVIGDTETSELTARDRVLAAWARKVVHDPNGTTKADVENLRAAGLTEKEIFEVTAFVAFRLAFSTVNDALGAEPDWQLVDAVPQEVVSAVGYGRAAAVRPENGRVGA
jgi:uncharacterized peroxidase-related enzyme